MGQSVAGWLAAGMWLAIGWLLPTGPAAGASFGPHLLDDRSSVSTRICAFCHTPLGQQGGAPEWSPFQAAIEYQTFDAERAEGQIYVRGGVSVACLSCHDGGQAPDAQAYPWPEADGQAPLIRRRMTSDHPVGMVYSGFGPQGAAAGFESAMLRSDVIGTQTRWWLDSETDPDGIRDKTDVIFYTRGEGAAARPYVECSSCHDPHANPGEMFLRVTTSVSSLCSTCHNL